MTKLSSAERSRRYRTRNPERARARDRQYKNSAKGKATLAAWNKRNTATALLFRKNYRDKLPDAYLRSLLRHGMGIKNPTQKQIESHRTHIRILRAQRTFKLLAYASNSKSSN